mgnify:CR=1 FL=1
MKIKFIQTIFLLGLVSSSVTSCVGDDDYVIPTVYEYAFTDGFETNWADWTKFSATGTQAWTLDTQYGNPGNCAKMSGYAGTNNANEDWLISPAVDLNGLTAASLSFQTASCTYHLAKVSLARARIKYPFRKPGIPIIK